MDSNLCITNAELNDNNKMSKVFSSNVLSEIHVRALILLIGNISLMDIQAYQS